MSRRALSEFGQSRRQRKTGGVDSGFSQIQVVQESLTKRHISSNFHGSCPMDEKHFAPVGGFYTGPI